MDLGKRPKIRLTEVIRKPRALRAYLEKIVLLHEDPGLLRGCGLAEAGLRGSGGSYHSYKRSSIHVRDFRRFKMTAL
jgi:hypothetical protein